MSKISIYIIYLEREDFLLKDYIAKMLYYNIKSLEELEEIKHLKAKAAKKAKSSLLAFDSYSFLADINFPFDL